MLDYRRVLYIHFKGVFWCHWRCHSPKQPKNSSIFKTARFGTLNRPWSFHGIILPTWNPTSRRNETAGTFGSPYREWMVFLPQMLWHEYFCLKPPFGLGGGNSNVFLIFTPNLGEMMKFDKYVSKGLVQPPTSLVFFVNCVFFFR